jgi:hypothetical protein
MPPLQQDYLIFFLLKQQSGRSRSVVPVQFSSFSIFTHSRLARPIMSTIITWSFSESQSSNNSEGPDPSDAIPALAH